MNGTSLAVTRAAISRGDFACCYVLRGDDEYRKDALVRAIIESATDQRTRDFNLDVVRGPDVEADRLGSLLGTPPMMASRRVVVVRDAGSLSRLCRALLSRYLARPSSDVVAVLLLGSGDDLGFGDGVTVVEIGGLSEAEAAAWIEEQVRLNGGHSITPLGRDLLIRNVGLDTARLSGEIDKLVSYSRGARIDDGTVAEVIGVREGADLGEFLDRVAAGDAIGASLLVEPLLAQPRVTLVTVIMALTSQMLGLAWGRRKRARGLPEHQLEKEYYSLLKRTGAFPMRPWGEAVRCWTRNVRRWDSRSVDAALRVLGAADRGAKDVRVSSESQYLATVVYAVIGVQPAKVA